MSKEKRLGRGLEALLGKVAAAQPPVKEANDQSYRNQNQKMDDSQQLQNDSRNGSIHSESFKTTELEFDSPGSNGVSTDQILNQMMNGRPTQGISVDLIDRNPFQPRLDFDPDELNELALSIEKHGMIQPVVLRQKENRFELIAGERRLRAAIQAGWKQVPAHLLIVEDREMAELALTENIQRKDLNAIEKATAFRNYLDIYGGTHEELARRLELERSTVTNLMRLLELPEELQLAVRQNVLTQGHARALLPLEEWEQHDVASRIVKEGWSVRQTEAFVQELLAQSDENGTNYLPPPPSSKRKTAQSDPQILELEQQFRTRLGTKVQLVSNDKGKGKLVIPFNSADEFERVYQLICPTK
ncbi:MAG: ParB/RepB/Spo0J family partition protein [Planctomycetia bacterium]|nr:ParB/RepB/Spo0J family partition protein [Planctomycetia bacterium]